MGLEYVFASELKLRTCPYCGSNTFNVTVGRKVEAEEKWSWEDGKRRVLETLSVVGGGVADVGQ